MAQSVGLSMQNAVANQQNMSTIDTAVTTQGVNLIYSMDVASGAVATKDIYSSGVSMSDLVSALSALKKN